MNKEKVISEKIIFKGKVFDIVEKEVLQPNNKITTREILKLTGAVSVVPITKDGDIILVKQYRAGIERYTLEFPGGKLEKGEDKKEAAIRELREETGYIATTIKEYGVINPASGYSNDILYFYLCEDLEKPGNQDLDNDEFINVVKLSPSKLKEKIISGEITDGKVMAFGLKYLLESNKE